MKKSQTLDIQTISALRSIFKQKGWPEISSETGEQENLFDTFCEFFKYLKFEEQNIMLKLTSQFNRYTFGDYLLLLNKSFQKIDTSLFQNREYVFLISMKSLEDRNKGHVKSGDFVTYMMKSKLLSMQQTLGIKRVIDLEDLFFLSKNHSDRKNSLLLILDDFIGSGDTAKKFIDEYNRKFNKKCDTTLVIGFVALTAGIKMVQDLGHNIITVYEHKKGISESDLFSDTVKAISIMDQIENRLKIPDKYCNGYKKSEALVKMIRVPNNTFPVYWWNKIDKNNYWPAPFMR